MESDLRWRQRLSNYLRAISELEEAVVLSRSRQLSKLEIQGLIQCFEYTFELAWQTLKDLLENRGQTGFIGSRDVFRQSFKLGLISEGEVWMEMIKSRNLTSHLYDQGTANGVAELIVNSYLPKFIQLRQTLTKIKGDE